MDAERDIKSSVTATFPCSSNSTSIRSRKNSAEVKESQSSNNEWQRRESTVSTFDFHGVLKDAKDATEREHSIGVFEAIKMHRAAVGWSLLLSTAIIMEGYDLQVTYGFFGLPAFAQKYGARVSDGSYQISATWQSALSNGNLVGQMLGLLSAGFLADRFGYRKSIAVGLLLVICFIFITFFAPGIAVLLVGEILCGIPWGMFETLTTAYAAELSPVVLRPYFTSYINLCWVFGQIVGSGVLRAFVSRTDKWAYKIPFALQWIWPLPLLIGVILAPESPWWLVRQNKLEQAEAVVNRLTSSKREHRSSSRKTVAMMIHTDELEKSATSGSSYMDCFKGVDLRRTEICCMVWMSQILCGGGLMSYTTYFYEQAGLSASNSFDMTIGQFGLGAIGVGLAWVLMPWFGRRTLFLTGLALLSVLLLIIGLISITHQTSGTAWAIGSMLLIYAFVYDVTVGPLCYSLVSEVASSRLRQKTIAIARNAYILSFFVSNAVTPRMINPTAWNWKGKAGFFWAGSCSLMLVWAYFRLVEPKGRTYAELDYLFEYGIPARQFAATKVDLFEETQSKDDQFGSEEEKKVAQRTK